MQIGPALHSACRCAVERLIFRVNNPLSVQSYLSRIVLRVNAKYLPVRRESYCNTQMKQNQMWVENYVRKTRPDITRSLY